MNLRTILEQAIEEKASDVFIVSGLPVSFRKDGVIKRVNEERLLPPDTESLLTEIYQHAGERDLRILEEGGDDDVSASAPISSAEHCPLLFGSSHLTYPTLRHWESRSILYISEIPEREWFL